MTEAEVSAAVEAAYAVISLVRCGSMTFAVEGQLVSLWKNDRSTVEWKNNHESHLTNFARLDWVTDWGKRWNVTLIAESAGQSVEERTRLFCTCEFGCRYLQI